MTGQPGKKRTPREARKEAHPEVQLTQATLNDQQEQGDIYLFLTNRYNLLDVLSSGLIKPASRYAKYYADLGVSCTEGIPLLVNNPSSSLVESVIGPEFGAFPILLEIDLHDMYGPVQVIRDDYRLEQAELLLRGEAIAIVMSGVIPLSRVRAVHFRSASELEEHLAREYENIRSSTLPLRISPERFRGSSVDVKLLLETLVQINQITTPLPPEVFSAADALGGALLLLGGLITHDPDAALTTLIPPLEGLQNPTSVAEALETIQHTTGTGRWIALLPALLLRESELFVGAEETSNFLAPLIDGRIDGDDFAAFLLFVAAVTTLSQMSPDHYYNAEALVRIRDDFEAQLASALLEETNRLLLEYQSILHAVQAVLLNRLDLEEFPYSRLPVATALLLFLLRSEPARVLSWIEEKRRPTPDLLELAVSFSGALYGRAMIPAACRPDISYEQYIDRMLARRMSTLSKGVVEPADAPGKSSLKSDVLDGILRETLKVSGHVLVQREIQVHHRESPTGQDLPERGENALQRLLESDLRSGAEKTAALYLCRTLGWDDCVTTTVPLEGRRYVLSAADPQKPELRISGFLIQPPEISVHADRFRKQLTTEAWSSLPEQTRQDIEGRLRDSDRFELGTTT